MNDVSGGIGEDFGRQDHCNCARDPQHKDRGSGSGAGKGRRQLYRVDQSSEEKAKDTLVAIRAIKDALGDKVCVGAGTVMSVDQVHQAVEAGAEYMISPNVNEAVIRETKKLDKVSIPGAMTPTEAAFAYECGADIVKLFPAGLLGAAYIKAVKAPLKHIPVTAVGNVNVENCAEFLKAGAVGVGVGGSLVSAKLVDEGRFDEITATAKAYVEALAR